MDIAEAVEKRYLLKETPDQNLISKELAEEFVKQMRLLLK